MQAGVKAPGMDPGVWGPPRTSPLTSATLSFTVCGLRPSVAALMLSDPPDPSPRSFCLPPPKGDSPVQEAPWCPLAPQTEAAPTSWAGWWEGVPAQGLRGPVEPWGGGTRQNLKKYLWWECKMVQPRWKTVWRFPPKS